MKIYCKYDSLVSPKELKSHPKNRNTHSPDQIERLSELYKYHGVRHPIIVSKLSGCIVAGHGRRDAAIHSKIKKFPVVYQNFEDKKAEYAFLQSDNAIALWAELDLKQIRLDIPELGDDFNLDMLGIKNLDAGDETKGKCGDDEIPEKVPAKTRLGDIYTLGIHRLMCGDSTNVSALEKLMNGDKADLWLTDPPYGVSYQAKNAAVHGGIVKNQAGQDGIDSDEKSLEEMKTFWRDAAFAALSVASNEAAYYWFACQGGDQMMMMMMMMLGDAGWLVRHELIWVKPSLVFGRSDYHYRHEPIIYGWKRKGKHHWFSDRKQTSVLEFDRPHKSDLHPTMKPVELIGYLMSNSSKKGQIVLDTFGGSGSTMIAAEKCGRAARLMEISPHYCDVIVARWEEYTGKKADLVSKAEQTRKPNRVKHA
jgi:DNA modification methylase